MSGESQVGENPTTEELQGMVNDLDKVDTKHCTLHCSIAQHGAELAYMTHTLHFTTLHYITLHYTTLHYTNHTTLHYTTQHYSIQHYTTIQYTTLHLTTLQTNIPKYTESYITTTKV